MIQCDEHIQLPTSYINIYQLQKIQTGPSIDWQPVLGNPPEKFQLGGWIWVCEFESIQIYNGDSFSQLWASIQIWEVFALPLHKKTPTSAHFFIGKKICSDFSTSNWTNFQVANNLWASRWISQKRSFGDLDFFWTNKNSRVQNNQFRDWWVQLEPVLDAFCWFLLFQVWVVGWICSG